MLKDSFYNIELKTDANNNHLIFNSNSLAIAWLTNTEYHQLLNGQIEESSEIGTQMKKCGFLVDFDRDEQREIQEDRIHKISNTEPKCLSFVIAPTLQCNMNCVYCFESNLTGKTSMVPDDISYVVDFLKRQIENNKRCTNVRITWFGGEPTLKINIIREISKHIIVFCESKGIHYKASIITNGLLLSKKTAQLLYDDCKVTSAQITIDGLRDTYAIQKGTPKESFDIVVDNIKAACSIFKIRIRINAHPKNIREIINLIKFLLVDCKLNNKIALYVAPIFDCVGNSLTGLYNEMQFIDHCNTIKKNLNPLHLKFGFQNQFPKRNTVFCAAISEAHFCIGPDLSLYRCEHMLGLPQYKLGTVFDTEITPTTINVDFLEYKIPSECYKCKYYPVCQGGCHASKYIDMIPFHCEFIKERTIFQVMNLLNSINSRTNNPCY